MGLLLLTVNKDFNNIRNVKVSSSKYVSNLHSQGMIVDLTCGLSIGFTYCRTTPTESDIEEISQMFKSCDAFMGDLNISHRIKSHKEKLVKLCGNSKVNCLNEITRSISNNQLIM